MSRTQIPVENRVLFEEIRQMLQQGLSASFTVTGNSMWPLLASRRDQVVLEKPEKPLKKGDIVLFMPVEGQYLLHRIDKIRQDGFRTSGDGNCFRDGFFPAQTVIGRVVTLKRKGKEIPCNRLWVRCYSTLWRWCFPVRKPILRLLHLRRGR